MENYIKTKGGMTKIVWLKQCHNVLVLDYNMNVLFLNLFMIGQYGNVKHLSS